MPTKVPTLKELREGVGRPLPPPPMTQAEVELRSEIQGHRIDQTTLSKIERGKRNPGPKLLWHLAGIYGVDYDYIRACALETLRQHRTKRA